MTSLADRIRAGDPAALDIAADTPTVLAKGTVRALVDRVRALEAEKEAAEADADRLAADENGYVDDDECSLDHDGNCQTHFIEKPCSVAGRRAALAAHTVQIRFHDR